MTLRPMARLRAARGSSAAGHQPGVCARWGSRTGPSRRQHAAATPRARVWAYAWATGQIYAATPLLLSQQLHHLLCPPQSFTPDEPQTPVSGAPETSTNARKLQQGWFKNCTLAQDVNCNNWPEVGLKLAQRLGQKYLNFT
jgi:hypothetical protein